MNDILDSLTRDSLDIKTRTKFYWLLCRKAPGSGTKVGRWGNRFIFAGHSEDKGFIRHICIGFI